jgi:hypothetical protein
MYYTPVVTKVRDKSLSPPPPSRLVNMESQPGANKREDWGSFYSNMDIEKTTEKMGGFFSYLWTHLALVLSAATAAVHVVLVV